MHYRPICSALGLLVLLLSLFMLPSLGWSLYDGDGLTGRWFGAIVLVMGIGLAMFMVGWRSRQAVLQREALAIVGLGWLVGAAAGAIPFVLTGTIPSFTDAFFETISGMTTTGATILVDIEALPRSALFWRSMTHWLGGIGIIVIFIAILPFFSSARRRLYRSEIPGVTAEGLTPRVRQTALALLKIYLILSAAECVLLMAGGMDLFEALCHTFGTVATGGFSTRNASIGAFNSLYIEIVIVVFMFLAGCNFTLHYLFGQRRWSIYWHDTEFRAYALTLIGAVAILTGVVWLAGGTGLGASLRGGIFSAVSIMTTTGFGTADFDQWPTAGRALLVILMFIGGSGGSTAGGLKVVRYVLLFRHLFNQVERQRSPRTVRQVRMGGRVVDDALQFQVLSFFFAAMVITGVMTMLVALLEPEATLVTAFTAVAATINNIGPGLEAVGPTQTFAFLGGPAKWLLSLCMVMGRLEYMAILVLFAPRFWTER